jgi:hypothetical protein
MRIKIELLLDRCDLDVLKVALNRYANDHPDTQGYHIALSIKDAAEQSFYQNSAHVQVEHEMELVGNLQCRLCPCKKADKISMIRHIRTDHVDSMFPPGGLKEAVDLFNSWYL